MYKRQLYELFASLPFRLLRNPINAALLQTLGGRACPWHSIRFIDRYDNESIVKIPDPTDSTKTISFHILQAHQEMTSIALWSPVASSVFASSVLPIVATQTSVPRNLGTQGNYVISGGNNSNLLPILSDFAIAVDANNQYRPMVEYNPGAEYRLNRLLEGPFRRLAPLRAAARMCIKHQVNV